MTDVQEDNWITRLKKRPIIGGIILAATVGAALLAWSVGVIENAPKVISFLGVETAERRKTLLNAYILGQKLSVASFYLYAARTKNKPLEPDGQAEYETAMAEAQARGSLLGLTVDLKTIHFETEPGKELSSAPGVRLIERLLTQHRDIAVSRAFTVGFERFMYYWMALANMLPKQRYGFGIGIEVAAAMNLNKDAGFPKCNIDTNDPAEIAKSLDAFHSAVYQTLER